MDFTEPEHFISLISTILLVMSEILPFLPCRSNGIADFFTQLLKGLNKIENKNTKSCIKKESEDTSSSSEDITEVHIMREISKYDNSSSSEENKHHLDYEDCQEVIEEKVDAIIKIIKKRDKIDSKVKHKIHNLIDELKKYS